MTVGTRAEKVLQWPGLRGMAALGLVGLALLTGCATSSGTGFAQSQEEAATAAASGGEGESDAQRRARIRLELAASYFERGQFNVALDEIRQVLAINPNLADAYNLRGLVFMRLDDQAMAQESFRRAASLRPNDPDVAHNYGWLLCQQKNYVQAQQQFEQVKAQVEKQQQQKMQMLAQSEQLSKNIGRLEQQKDTLKQQSAQILNHGQQDELQQLEQQKAQLQAACTEKEQQIASLKQQLEQRSEQQAQQKSALQELKSDIQVLQSEQKNLNQLLIKASPKAQAGSVRLMQALQLSQQGKAQASLIEKFLAKWLHAQVLDGADGFQDSVARQLKAQGQHSKIQLNGLPCLADWIEAPQHSLWQQVAVVESLKAALPLQAQLQAGQSILTLDGYHAGADWVIGLHYDEDSQAGQGALSHRIRLSEIEQALARIDNGTYGICEMSYKVIPIPRLEAIPFARLTVECQAQWEKEKGQNARFRPRVALGFAGGQNDVDLSVSLDDDEE